MDLSPGTRTHPDLWLGPGSSLAATVSRSSHEAGPQSSTRGFWGEVVIILLQLRVMFIVYHQNISSCVG